MNNKTLSHLQEMDSREFEHLIGDLWQRMGYETDVVKHSADKGIDVRAQ